MHKLHQTIVQYMVIYRYNKSIRMFRDLCPSDREERKKLVVEMKRKNQEIEESDDKSMKWIIRGNVLVKVKTPFQMMVNLEETL